MTGWGVGCMQWLGGTCATPRLRTLRVRHETAPAERIDATVHARDIAFRNTTLQATATRSSTVERVTAPCFRRRRPRSVDAQRVRLEERRDPFADRAVKHLTTSTTLGCRANPMRSIRLMRPATQCTSVRITRSELVRIVCDRPSRTDRDARHRSPSDYRSQYAAAIGPCCEQTSASTVDSVPPNSQHQPRTRQATNLRMQI